MNKVKYVISTLIFLFWSQGSMAQSQDQNYIRTQICLDQNDSSYRDRITYYDDLGRVSESVVVGDGKNISDLLSLQEYDEYGRKSRTWLPGVADSGNDGSFMDPVRLKQQSISDNNDVEPYSYFTYDNSPLDSVVALYGPGQDWHNKGKADRIIYSTNKGSDPYRVIRFTYKSSDWNSGAYNVTNSGYYNEGMLDASESADEDGHKTYIFKNMFGEKILVRHKVDDVYIDTYYIYDNMGNVLAILPPLAVDEISEEGITLDCSLELGDYAYVYGYDYRGRLIMSKMPGAGENHYWYDKSDNRILTEDPNGNITFCITDKLGRVCLRGTCTNRYSADQYDNDALPVTKAERTDDASEFMGYKVTGIKLTNPRITNVYYYDDYSYLKEYPKNLSSCFQSSNNVPVTKNMLTGSVTALLKDTVDHSYIYSSVYYDMRMRPVLTYESNQMGGFSKSQRTYDYTGNVLSKADSCYVPGCKGSKLDYTYTYDMLGRLTTETLLLDGKYKQQIYSCTYDNLGRLSTRCQSSSKNCQIQYTYNVRRQMTSLQCPLFHENVYYNQPRDESSDPCYNGDISSIQYGYRSAIQSPSEMTSYDYHYDSMDRIVQSDYIGYKNDKGTYDTSYLYDKQGNIVYLSRNNIEPESSEIQMADDVQLTYQGNQLKSYKDNGFDVSSRDILLPGHGGASAQYSYDNRGNMTADTNKGIMKIVYNLLNLPYKVYMKNGNLITYIYDANGEKRSAEYGTYSCNISIPATGIMTKELSEGDISNYKLSYRYDYIDKGKYQYYTDKTNPCSLNYIHTDGLLIRNSDLYSMVCYYELTDHQGNIRYIAKNGTSLGDLYEYYPFGGSFNVGWRGANTPFKYNGKELESDDGLDWYDYAARRYDPALGRFTSIDPLAAKYPDVSPYAYCSDNPIRYTDPDGRKIYCGTHDAVYYDAQSGKYVCNNYANAGTREIVSDLGLTKEGTKMLKMAVMSPTKISFVLSKQTKIEGKTFEYGKTNPGNDSAKDHYGKRMGTKGYYKNKAYYTTATITIYKGTIAKDALAPDSKHPGMGIEEAIGAVAGHEITHAANPKEVDADIRYERSHVDPKGNSLPRPTGEIEALHVEGIIDNESLNR